MKKQIRMNVFETNSSSTHSLQIHKQTMEEANTMVIERIKKSYEDRYPEDYTTNPEHFINDNVLTLNGLDFESGDESGNVYYIIKTWIAKLQYLGMYLYTSAYEVEDFDRVSYKASSSFNSAYYKDDTYELLIKTDVFKAFKTMVIDYVNAKTEYNISDIFFDIRNTVWIEEPIIGDGNKVYRTEKRITVESFSEMFYAVMDDETILTYADEAYRPYERPQVYTI